MHYRPLGKTGARVSEIGMGSNRLGEDDAPEAHWVDLVRKAVDLGVNIFDTAEAYGWGRSEEILAKAIGNNPNVIIATKVSQIRETGEKEFSAKRILERVEHNLRRLRRDCIDIYQLHSPTYEKLLHYDWADAMLKLKEQGKIRWIGVSINDVASGRWLIEQGLVDTLQLAYNMLEYKVGQAVLPLAYEHGVGVLVRMPMERGILSGKFRAGEPVPAHYRAHKDGPRMLGYIERAEDLRGLAEGQDLSLAQIALRYVLSSAGVSATIPGARNIEQLTQNVAASNGVGLDDGLLQRIAAIQQSWGA